jgi:hypothetical protein
MLAIALILEFLIEGNSLSLAIILIAAFLKSKLTFVLNFLF